MIVIMASVLFVIMPYGLWAHYKMGILEGVIVQEQENRIVVKDRYGRTEAEIDLERDYKITTRYVGYEEAVYRIKQEGQVFEFCTKTNGAEHLVKDVLKLKGAYPPIAPWNFGW
jgi:hypothetical protein